MQKIKLKRIVLNFLNILYKLFPKEFSLAKIDPNKSINWLKQPLILDIAGGKGDVAWELSFHQQIATIVIDPNCIKLSESRSKRMLSKAWRSLNCPKPDQLKKSDLYIKNNYNDLYQHIISSNFFHKKQLHKAGISLILHAYYTAYSMGLYQYQQLFNQHFIDGIKNDTFTSSVYNPSSHNVDPNTYKNHINQILSKTTINPLFTLTNTLEPLKPQQVQKEEEEEKRK